MLVHQPIFIYSSWNYKYLDRGYDVKGVFLENSKALAKIRHSGVVFKLEQNGIPGNLRMILQVYLDERKKRIVLNGQVFPWASVVTAGVVFV